MDTKEHCVYAVPPASETGEPVFVASFAAADYQWAVKLAAYLRSKGYRSVRVADEAETLKAPPEGR